MSAVTATATTAAGATASGGGAASSTTDPLASLSGNFSSFLSLLMTQLQNQDPTSPLDTSQFTSQLVQFASVEQQINTNTNLTKLIQLTQGSEVVQSTQMLGHKVAVTSDHLSLQNGAATLQFTPAAAGPVSVVVTDSTGNQLYSTTLAAGAGSNTWTWNGQDYAGTQHADGSYGVTVTAANADGTTAAVPFTVLGTATGVKENGQTVQLELGGLAVDFSAIQSVVN